MRLTATLLATLVVAAACAGGADEAVLERASTTLVEPTTTAASPTTTTAASPTTFDAFAGIRTIKDFTASGLDRWRESVPGIEDRRIASTADGSEQPVLWLEPEGSRARPLLVILHSWSAAYDQHAGIPFAAWAAENGWAVVAPNFRGVNDDAEAVGSDMAVQDVVDAIDFAVAQEGVDADRVYAVGYSGGGMMALLLAGRHPDKVDAVAAWGPPADLLAFYENSARRGASYVADIRAACGGDPTTNPAARDECVERSALTYADNIRDGGVDVLLGQGIDDTLVLPNQTARTFNVLADPGDRLTDGQVAAIGRGEVPSNLSSVTVETYFSAADPAPVLARASASILLVYVDAGHDMVYEATARWFADHRRDRPR